MDWESINFDWNHARAFLVTAEEGSFSAAARALNLAQPTLGRQVTSLEESLGVVLFERVGRGLMLTPSGEALIEHVRAMGDAANRVSINALGQAQSIEGNICISASEIYSAYLLPPIIAKLRRLAPEVNIDIIASNDETDLERHEADIAIRNFRPDKGELIARKIKDVPAYLYASSNYLKTLSQPVTFDSLKSATYIGFDHTPMTLEGYKDLGLDITQSNFQIITANHLVHWELVKQGVGIGIVPDHIGDIEPKVQRVLPQLKPIMFPIWLTSHRELKTSHRVRLVFDLLADELQSVNKTSAT